MRGEPQRALELITEVRETIPDDRAQRACGRQYADAIRRQGAAEAFVVWVETMKRQQEGMPPPALKCDGGPATVGDRTLDDAISKGVDWALECDQSNKRALNLQKELDRTRSQELSDSWADLKAKYVEPWAGLLAAFLIWMVGALLIVRVIPIALHNNYLPAEAPASMDCKKQRRIGAQLSGWALIAIGAGVGTIGASAAESFRWLILAVPLALGGILLIDQARRWAPRLQVDSKGDGVSAEHVRALVYDLGSQTPRGIEVPSGADATFLQDIGIVSGSKNPVVQAVAWLISITKPVSPWVLRIEGQDEKTLNVELFRNYALIDAAVISREHLLRFLDDDVSAPPTDDDAAPPDFAVGAAALTVTTMANVHGFGGIGGATRWQSVGLHYVGTKLLPLGHQHRRPILARAVVDDAGNRMAQLAYWHDLYRRADTSPQLVRYARLLTQFVEDSRVAQDNLDHLLLLRARYSLAAVYVNLRALEPPRATNAQVEEAFDRLITLRDKCLQDEDLKSFAQSMFSAITTLGWSLAPPDDANVPTDCRTPVGYYNAACYLASQPDLSDESAAMAVEYLVLAGDDPIVEKAKESDPQLDQLRKHSAYLEVFGADIPEDLLSIEPFAAHADPLKNAALTTPRSFLSVSAWDLQSIGISRPVAIRQKALATVASGLHDPIKAWAVSIIAEMAKQGLFQLPTDDETREELVKNVVAATESMKEQPSEDDLDAHLQG